MLISVEFILKNDNLNRVGIDNICLVSYYKDVSHTSSHICWPLLNTHGVHGYQVYRFMVLFG